MTQHQKREAIKQYKLCENCLMSGHFAKNCKSWSTCRKCNKKHHTLLHKDQGQYEHNKTATFNSREKKNESNGQTDNNEKCVKGYFASNINQPAVLLATAIVRIQRSNGTNIEIRALIDQGSQATFITEDIVQQLRLKKHKIDATVSGIGNTRAGKINSCVEVMMLPRFDSSFVLHAKALVMPRLTALLPERQITDCNWKHVEPLVLADPTYATPGDIDMIIGADVFGQIILDKVIKGQPGSPVAQKTEFGYILSGDISKQETQQNIQCFVTETDLGKELCKFWESEELTPERAATSEELECELHYRRTHKRGADGRYVVRIPFRITPTPADLQGSRDIALARLFQLERKFKNNSQLERMYKEFIHEYIRLGHMTPAEPDNLETKYYLPHHAVFKHDSTTTKLRVVFDASIKRDNHKSLNELMMIGANLQQNLIEILFRWQKHKIVFTADIEKMYRQIKVDSRDQDLQRILWRDSPRSPIKEYKLTTVTYGTASAPFLAIRTLRQIALDEGSSYPMAAKIILKDTYVDDVVSGTNSQQEALATCNQLIALLKGGGFNLRKWNSNDPRILKHIPDELKDLSRKTFDDGETIKALGIHWDPRTDNFKFKINIQPDPIIITKRSILSEAPKIFDPIGLLSPVTVKIKLLFQQIWLEKMDWDDAVSAPILEIWSKIKDELASLENIEIPRWFGYTGVSDECQLHGFSDASEKAYSAAVYMRITSQEGKISTKLLAAKTKVAPLQARLSLPRLELNGALLLARLMNEVKKALEIENLKCFAWTDSKIVLSWLRGDPHKWKTFVANRVAEIQALIHPNQWFHVNSEYNPADVASRGIYPAALKNYTMWWKGPEWLSKIELKKPETSAFDTCLELKENVTAHTTIMEAIKEDPEKGKSYKMVEILMERYSSLPRIKMTLAHLLRYKNNLRPKVYNRISGPITVNDCNSALHLLIKMTQEAHFKEELELLKKGEPVSNKSRLMPLFPILDKQSGLLRVGGRLEESNMSYEQKHPYILPYESRLTTLVIRWSHSVTLHGGNFKTLEHVRQWFWILNGLKAVKCHIHRCTICHRFKATSAKQLMGNLPKPRVEETTPFTSSGVDYAGPFTLKAFRGRGTITYKGYIALFICLSTKAVHLEVVTDLTSAAFLAAFKRFVSRRGPIAHLYSDNGKNFVGASKILAELIQDPIYQSEVSSTLVKEGTQWHFIPPVSPHFGGLWEAGIKATKHHLRRVMGESLLTYEELSTLVTMIEACMNSRPLCPLSNDPESLGVLTPGHFLIGKPLLSAPQENLISTNASRLDRWRLLDKMHQEFWKKWSSEYLSRLQQRPKWGQEEKNINIGNIVLIKDENLPPTRWSLGRVVDIHPGKDGLVRVVTLKTESSMIKRCITKLSLLPIVDNEEEITLPAEYHKGVEHLSSHAAIVSSGKRESPKITSKRKGKTSLNHENSKKERLDEDSNTNKTNHRKSKLNRLVSGNPILFAIIVGLLLVLTGAENVPKSYSTKQFEKVPGMYFETIADTNIYVNEWVLLVHFNLKNYWNQLSSMKHGVTKLKTLCEGLKEDNESKKRCMPLTTQLGHQITEIEDANRLLYQQNNQQIARAMFRFIGNIANSLFGVLDQEYAENYEKQINEVRNNENHMASLLQRQTSIVDSTLNLFKKEKEDVHQQLQAVTGHLTTLEEAIVRNQVDSEFNENFISVALLLSLDISSFQHVQQALLSVITDTHHGKFSTLLLTPAQLNTQLQLIRQHLPRDLKIPEDSDETSISTLYTLMQAKTRITTGMVIFELRIPLLDAEGYKLYQLIPIPAIQLNEFIYIQPSSKFLLVNMHRDRYSPLTEYELKTCRTWNNDHLLCKLNVPMYNLRANVSRCEIELLTKETKLSPFCNFRKTIARAAWIKLHASNSWIYILEKRTSFEVICGSKIEEATLMRSGKFQLRSGCFIKHPSMFLAANAKISGILAS